MVVPEIAGVGLTNPWAIGVAVVVVVAIAAGVLWWLRKEGKI